MIKQFYFYQLHLALVNKVKWLQVLLCMTNKLIKHQSFIYTRLNDQTVLFKQFDFAFHLFALNLNVQFDPQTGLYQVLSLWNRVDVGEMAMKRYSAFPKASADRTVHQTGLDTRSMTRRSIIVGISGGEGQARTEAWALNGFAGPLSGMWA